MTLCMFTIMRNLSPDSLHHSLNIAMPIIDSNRTNPISATSCVLNIVNALPNLCPIIIMLNYSPLYLRNRCPIFDNIWSLALLSLNSQSRSCNVYRFKNTNSNPSSTLDAGGHGSFPRASFPSFWGWSPS